MRSSRLRASFVIATVVVAGCNRQAPVDPRMITEWMRTLFGAVRVERASPPVAARIYAYASTAMYSGLAATSTTMPPLTGHLREFPVLPSPDGRGYDRSIVAVAAEQVVVDTMFREALGTTKSALDRLADSLSTARGASAAMRQRSEDLGRRIGYAIIAWSHQDGFDSTRGKPYTIPKGIGKWVNDSPANWYAVQSLSGASQEVTLDNPANKMSAANTSDRSLILDRPKSPGGGTLLPVNMAGVAEPYWGTLRPFVLPAWNSCPAGPPPVFSDKPGSPLYEDAMKVYETRKNLTQEQRMTALFWADNPVETATPSGHWLSIASQLIGEQHLSAEDAARTMLLTSVALHDGFIAVWGYKFSINLLRPRQYIRAYIDPSWEPAIPTPPFPEFMAGHSGVSAAASTVLISQLGDVAFDDSTHVNIGHPVRHFSSLQEAGDQAGHSRVLAGIHFPTGVAIGRKVGQCIGNTIINVLKPVLER